MKTLYVRLLAFALLVLLATPLYAQESEQPAEVSEQPAEVQESEQPADVQEPTSTLIAVAQETGTFTTLLRALDTAELTAVLEGEGPFIMYAPTDEAFAKLPEGTVEEWLKPENKDQLVAVLSNHIVKGPVAAGDAATATTLTGNDLTISTTDDGVVMINDATVTQADVEASNGVIHVIDTVLVPPSDMKKDADGAMEDTEDTEDTDGNM